MAQMWRRADHRDMAASEQLSKEYYNSETHPTCHNFREASAKYIKKSLSEIDLAGDLVEVGAGSSVLAELLSDSERELQNVLLTDISLGMLKHSVRFKKMGAALLVADATKLPLKSKSLSGIIASLGDPYNTDEFWREVARSLRPDGVCIFTTPAFEWSNAYRRSVEVEREDFAYFQLQDGRSLYVP